ncbi:hypothetical protein [Azotosporobacter soli]|uniref:hypothetical protein n=1 Tax=Azotosporobacter soli TaxID=3055040 RepID=UPI0031FF4102
MEKAIWTSPQVMELDIKMTEAYYNKKGGGSDMYTGETGINGQLIPCPACS